MDNAESQNRRIHQAIEKLTDEWMQITPVIQIAAFDTNASFYLVGFLVESVYQSLQLDAKEITVVPSFGRQFHLVKFRYAPNVALVSMPVFALQTPWEWSVLWHELATLVIANQEVSEWITTFATAARQTALWQRWLLIDAEQPAPAADPFPHAPVDAVVVDPIGDIDQIGWMEELVEDACSILVLGPVAYRVLHSVLAQRNEQMDIRSDTRHPPPNLRLEVAYQLLWQMAQGEAASSLTAERLNHGRYVDDSGAALVAQWIWHNKDRLVKMTFDDWDEAANDQENIVQKATRSVIQQQMEKDTPLSRAAQYVDTHHSANAADDATGIIGLLRRIISDGRQVLGEPDLGKVIYNQATDLLAQWLQSVYAIAGHEAYSPSQAQPFIAANIQAQPWVELEKLTFSSVDHMSATLVSGGHAAGTTPPILGVTVSGYTHNQYHERTYALQLILRICNCGSITCIHARRCILGRLL
ncbi:MAG: hypothetical protein R3E79_57705 [Caldilineaceae bacterium]